MTTCSSVIANSGVKFGTSGARGLVSDFTPLTCQAFTLAFLHAMQANFEFKTVAVGIDNRPSSPEMAQSIITTLEAMGFAVAYYGVLPTPALAFSAMQQNIPCIMVTGSHIPFDRNGLKFYTPEGEISKADEKAILSAPIPVKELPLTPLPVVNSAAIETYTQRITELFPATIFAGKKIGIYEHSSAGRDIYAAIFTELGAEVVALERSDEFVPIDTEAVSDADQAKALAWSEQYGFDMIFSTDGDGDRPLISDEHGQWLRGDIVGLISAQFLGLEALAVPVSCNTAIEKTQRFAKVERTRIGSPYVIAEFLDLAKDHNSVGGFEANGGFLLGSSVQYNAKHIAALPTRDALLPGILVLAAALAENASISQIVAALPQRFTESDRIKAFATEQSQAILARLTNDSTELLNAMSLRDEVVDTNTVDGLRLTLTNGDIVHLRPSGNAPELRCYAESNTSAQAKKLVVAALEAIQTL
ncbi:phosphomannomutase [Opacimonas viscosa]|uniref:Phosphomannomutase n=1 Tax=Opacimonas viscosa TaxID=2961944 RepID=A0AA41X355_9ALTE|nr:phosphomannomutase [Opacimonas viscosa]MCP3429496.1 phosphomannomutase [Opacimonas viscosa]